MKVESYTQIPLPLPDIPSLTPSENSEVIFQQGEEFFLSTTEQQQLIIPLSKEEFVAATQDPLICNTVLAPTIAEYTELKAKPKNGIHTLFGKNLHGEIIPNPQPELHEQQVEFERENSIAAIREIWEHHPNNRASSDHFVNAYNRVINERRAAKKKPKRERSSIFHPASQTSSAPRPGR